MDVKEFDSSDRGSAVVSLQYRSSSQHDRQGKKPNVFKSTAGWIQTGNGPLVMTGSVGVDRSIHTRNLTENYGWVVAHGAVCGILPNHIMVCTCATHLIHHPIESKQLMVPS